MQILSGGATVSNLQRNKTAAKGEPAVSARSEVATQGPPDVVSVGYDAVAIKAEEKKLAQHAKLGAAFGGAAGVVVGSLAGAVGGAVGAIAGITAAPAGALIGAVALGAGGFMLATHKRDGGLALVGGVLAGALGAVVGGFGGFYGGAALGALAGSAGGVVGGLAGAVGLGTLGAGFGAVAKVGSELVSNKEQYPNVIARYRAEEAKEGRA